MRLLQQTALATALLLVGCAAAPPTRMTEVPPPALPAIAPVERHADGAIYGRRPNGPCSKTARRGAWAMC